MVTREGPSAVRIRQAALELFAARGFDATGIRDIAQAASVPTSLIYHYRRSKQEILRDLLVEGMSRHVETSRCALELAHSPEEALRALVTVYALVPLRNPEMARVIESEYRTLSAESRRAIAAKRVESDERLETVLAAGVAEGVFTVPDLKLGRRLLRRMCTGIGLWFDSSGDLSVEDLVEGMVDHSLALVRARRHGRALRAAGVREPALERVREIVDAVQALEMTEG
jgi:AcrR family transcriptional regulator